MRKKFLPPLAVFVAFTSPVFAETKGGPFTDPNSAGPDYSVQGEYTGDNCAAQVIALGGGKFHVVGWRHGLPGAADEVEKIVEMDGGREGDKVVLTGSSWKGEILPSGELTGTNDEGKSWQLKRVVRTSPTAGAKPPAGAAILFDGSNADAWLGGRMTDDHLLWMGAKSKQAFGDCTLHVEFRLAFMPEARGQGRSNSGVYVQDRYEVQVLDSFGLKGENNECGGIYTVASPKVNMCFPPLTWQTYDIEFEAARFDADGKKTRNAVMTVKHNGVLIHDHVEVPHTTTSVGRAEGAEPGPIQLQNHGCPVVYRNIWVVGKK